MINHYHDNDIKIIPESCLARLTWKKTFRGFKAGQKINFDGPICVLVGECGSGKSTLLRALQIGTGDLVHIQYIEPLKVFYHDFEYGSPRIRPINSCCNEDELAVCLASARMSHGQSNLKYIQELEQASNCLILLDEPESGLSPKSIRNMYEIMKDRTYHGAKFIISTHSPILGSMNGRVLNLNNMRYENYKDWLKDSGLFTRYIQEIDND